MQDMNPRRLFNVVEFLMNDKDDSGTVSIEEAMQILYLRFGKGLLDSVSPELELYSWFDKLITFYDSHLVTPCCLLSSSIFSYLNNCMIQHLEDMFGTSDANSTSDLTLTEFLNSLHLSQAKHLRSTAKSHQQKR